MIVEFSVTEDEQEIKQLVSGCGLPSEDISLSHPKHFLVVRDCTQVAGVIGLELFDRSALLRSLAVLDAVRGKGIGTELLARAEQYAQACGVGTLYLLTTTAEEFLAKRGYQREDRNSVPRTILATTEFRELCPSSAVCMKKHLASANGPAV